MNFQVGQKVVCVDADDTNLLGLRELVVKNIYTISWIGPWERWANGQYIGIRVSEIINRSTPFRCTRFRPVVERKTDISIFTKMLKPETVT